MRFLAQVIFAIREEWFTPIGSRTSTNHDPMRRSVSAGVLTLPCRSADSAIRDAPDKSNRGGHYFINVLLGDCIVETVVVPLTIIHISSALGPHKRLVFGSAHFPHALLCNNMWVGRYTQRLILFISSYIPHKSNTIQ
jgi:hypothetical protein